MNRRSFIANLIVAVVLLGIAAAMVASFIGTGRA